LDIQKENCKQHPVYLYSEVTNITAEAKLTPDTCIMSDVGPNFPVSELFGFRNYRLGSVYLYSVCVPVFVQRSGNDLNLFSMWKSVRLTTSDVQLPMEFRIIMYSTLICCIWGRDDSVGIATSYELDGPGIESR
jgi:hypothetical protein